MISDLFGKCTWGYESAWQETGGADWEKGEGEEGLPSAGSSGSVRECATWASGAGGLASGWSSSGRGLAAFKMASALRAWLVLGTAPGLTGERPGSRQRRIETADVWHEGKR